MTINIRQIDWSKVDGGRAANIPNVFDILLSDDTEDRDIAFYGLRGAVNHQGSLYEASVLIIPFLLDLLRLDNFHDKQQILYLLGHLSGASPANPSAKWSELVHDRIIEGFELLCENAFES